MTNPSTIKPRLDFELTEGVVFDYNFGLRLSIYNRDAVVDVIDGLGGEVVAAGLRVADDGTPCHFMSPIKYYYPLDIRCRVKGQTFYHKFDLAGKPVTVFLSQKTLGDAVAWLMPAIRFLSNNRCSAAEVVVPAALVDLIDTDAYSDNITFTSAEDKPKLEHPFATYAIGFQFDEPDPKVQFLPGPQEHYSLQGLADAVLGLQTDKYGRPFLKTGELSEEVQGYLGRKYICIATQATCQAKLWNNPRGWDEVIQHFQKLGYEVYSVDQHETIYSSGWAKHSIPRGLSLNTLSWSLADKLALISGAHCFIGLSSGMSWLAWTTMVPVVLISGFTPPWYEFPASHRVYNPLATCRDCWVDPSVTVDQNDFLWCPRQENDKDKFICSRAISARWVIAETEKALGLNTLRA